MCDVADSRTGIAEGAHKFDRAHQDHEPLRLDRNYHPEQDGPVGKEHAVS